MFSVEKNLRRVLKKSPCGSHVVLVPSCFCARCQSKHQKHQAFEAELHANADRIRGVIDTGNALIQRGACAGSEDAVKVYSSRCRSVNTLQRNAL